MKAVLLAIACLLSIGTHAQTKDSLENVITEEDRRLAKRYNLATALDDRPEARAWAKITRIEYQQKKRVDDSVNAIRYEEEQAETAARYKKYRAEKFKRLEKQFGKVVAQKLVDQKLWIGMTDKMVTATYGPPRNISRTHTASGTTETWYYDYEPYYFNVNGLLTFKNHVVISITE